MNIAERTIKEIDPDINVIKMKGSVISKESFKCLLNTDYIFGCVDNDGARLFLNEVALAYNIGYFDVSSEILISENEYGGHIIFINGDNPCLYCLNEINPAEARKYLDNPNARKDEEAIYGIDKKVLNGSGPAVVSLNGIIASLAVNEFMLHVTGKRVANKFLTYYGSIGIVRKRNENRKEGCYYCESIKGQREKVDISNYFT
ncbi:MAG: ThiF family adenylyltransferase [Nanoarchaeota archaeon]|nr:ThiF family adenylyltransferase [Nanoarchaeota archaeon]